MPVVQPGEKHQPFVSQFEWCPQCKNWYRIIERKGRLDGSVTLFLPCGYGHIVNRPHDPNMDGEFQVGLLS